MCGRYYIDMDERERSHIIYKISQNSGPEGLRSVKIEGEVFPSDVVPVQTGIDRYEAMKWGFSKFDGKGAIINARSESALGERSMFKKSMMENRCLIPASSYFEWQDIGKRRKKKFEFFALDRSVLRLAGCYRHEKGSALPVFVILTRQAAPDFAEIHPRMPVLIPTPYHRAWLEKGPAFMQYAADHLSFRAVDGTNVPAGTRPN